MGVFLLFADRQKITKTSAAWWPRLERELFDPRVRAHIEVCECFRLQRGAFAHRPDEDLRRWPPRPIGGRFIQIVVADGDRSFSNEGKAQVAR